MKNKFDPVNDEKVKTLAGGGGFRLHEIPAARFMDQAQYIKEILLPEIAKKMGAESKQYKYFSEIYQSLLYCIMVKDRENNLLNKLQQIQQQNLILSNRNAFAEKELLKYATMEDLYLTEAHSYIEAGVRQRAVDLLSKK